MRTLWAWASRSRRTWGSSLGASSRRRRRRGITRARICILSRIALRLRLDLAWGRLYPCPVSRRRMAVWMGRLSLRLLRRLRLQRLIQPPPLWRRCRRPIPIRQLRLMRMRMSMYLRRRRRRLHFHLGWAWVWAAPHPHLSTPTTLPRPNDLHHLNNPNNQPTPTPTPKPKRRQV
ncbi:hypothetical protein BDZ97DRAFT_1783347 [Flammula alnicola]|nr:hypothetical protein BDZ97DRAFT_1783347 [Flammula alnicola]